MQVRCALMLTLTLCVVVRSVQPVSSTHLTLPKNKEVYIAVVRFFIEKKNQNTCEMSVVRPSNRMQE